MLHVWWSWWLVVLSKKISFNVEVAFMSKGSSISSRLILSCSTLVALSRISHHTPSELFWRNIVSIHFNGTAGRIQVRLLVTNSVWMMNRSGLSLILSWWKYQLADKWTLRGHLTREKKQRVKGLPWTPLLVNYCERRQCIEFEDWIFSHWQDKKNR